MAEWQNNLDDSGGSGEVTSRDFSDDDRLAFTFKNRQKVRRRKGGMLAGGRRPRWEPGEGEEQDVDIVAAQFLNEFVNWDRDRIREWQQALVAAGYLKKDSFIDGYADGDTLSALIVAAEEASVREKPLTDILTERAELFKEGGDPDEVSFREQREDEYKASLYRSYTKIWGSLPPPNVIESAAAAGINAYEFEWNEKQKPAYVNSPDYQMNRIGVEGRLADRFGALG